MYFILLFISWIGVFLELGYKIGTPAQEYSWLFAFILLIKTIGIIVNTIQWYHGQRRDITFSPIEALSCILVETKYENHFGYLLRTMPKFCVLMIFLWIIMVIYTALAFLIFNPESEEAQIFFPTFATGLWTMLMILNGANWPGTVVPAFHKNHFFFIFFLIYVTILSWGIVNLILGFIFLFFQLELTSINQRVDKIHEENLKKAFQCLDIENIGFLTYKQIDIILKEIYDFYEYTSISPTDDERYELILGLDGKNQLMIDYQQFCSISEKCSNKILKANRSKKRRFERYIQVNLLNERWKQLAIKNQSNDTSTGWKPLHDDDTDNNNNKDIHDLEGYNTVDEINNNNSINSTMNSKNNDDKEHDDANDDDDVTDDNANGKMKKKASDSPSWFNKAIENANEYTNKIIDNKVLIHYKSNLQNKLIDLNLYSIPSWNLYLSYYSMMVDSIYFDILSDTFINFLGLLFLCYPMNSGLLYSYLVFILLESILKLRIKGSYRYYNSYRNFMDGLITISLFLLIITSSSSSNHNNFGINSAEQILILFRLILYPRNILVTKLFSELRKKNRDAIASASKGFEHLIFMSFILFISLYIFAGLGQRLYGGAIIKKGDIGENISNSSYGQSHYWPLNFNDMMSGMVTMFTLLSINNQQITASGFVASRNQWVELFFASWYAYGVLMLLNIVTAIFLNQFTEYVQDMLQKKGKINSTTTTTNIDNQQQQQEELFISSSSYIDSDLPTTTTSPIGDLPTATTNEYLGREVDRSVIEVFKINQKDQSTINDGFSMFTKIFTVDEDHHFSTEEKSPIATTISSASVAAVDYDALKLRRLSMQSSHDNCIISNLEQHSSAASSSASSSPTIITTTSTGTSISDKNVNVSQYNKIDDNTTTTTNNNNNQNNKDISKDLSRLKINSVVSTATSAFNTKKMKKGITWLLSELDPVNTIDPTSIVQSRSNSNSRSSSSSIKTSTSATLSSVSPLSSPYTNVQNHSSSIKNDDYNSILTSNTSSTNRTTSIVEETTISKISTTASIYEEEKSDEFISKDNIYDNQKAVYKGRGIVALNDSIVPMTIVEEEVDEEKKTVFESLEQHVFIPFISAVVDMFDVQSNYESTNNNYNNNGNNNNDDNNDDDDKGAKVITTTMNTNELDSTQDGNNNNNNNSNDDGSNEVFIEVDSVEEEEEKGHGDAHNDDEGSGIKIQRKINSAPVAIHSLLTSSGSNSNDVVNPMHVLNNNNDDNDELHSDRNREEDDNNRNGSSIGGSLSDFNDVLRNSLDILLNVRDGNKRIASAKAVQDWMYNTTKISILDRAAVLIQFAIDGEEHSIHSSLRGLTSFKLKSYLINIFRRTSILLLLLKFFERPLWTYHIDNWNDVNSYPRTNFPFLPYKVIGSFRLILLIILWLGLCIEICYKESNFMNLVYNITIMRFLRCILFLLCLLQILLLFIGLSIESPILVTSTSFGTILYQLWFNRKSFNKLKVVLKVVPKFTIVMMIYLLMVVLFAAFGPFMLTLENQQQSNDDFFNTYSNSAWSIFVAITTSNYPNQVIPTYSFRRETFIYFVAFMTCGFIVLNLVVLIVLLEYGKESNHAIEIQKAIRKVLLIRAYEVLDEEKIGYITKKQLLLLFDVLYSYYSDFKKFGIPDNEQREVLLEILDIDGDGKITINDFLYLLDVSRIQISPLQPIRFISLWFPWLVKLKGFEIIENIVHQPYFDMFYDCFINLFISVSLFYNSHNTNNIYTMNNTKFHLLNFTISMMIIELILKSFVKGFKVYLRIFRNQYDGLISLLSLIMIIGIRGQSNIYDITYFTIILRILLWLRLIAIIRNIEISGVIRFTGLIYRILLKTLTLGSVFLSIGYIFASLGQLIYGGKINLSLTSGYYDELQSSGYGASNYYDFNFNDFTGSFVTLFCVLHVSDFDVITSGFSVATGKSARIFFGLWFTIGVALLLNIVKSFVIGSFIEILSKPVTTITTTTDIDIDATTTMSNYNNKDEDINADTKNKISNIVLENTDNPLLAKAAEVTAGRTTIGSNDIELSTFSKSPEDVTGG